MSDLFTQLPEARRWQQQAHPIPVVAAVICRDNEGLSGYLLIKRIHQPYAGKWALIGGKWDFGETLSQAVTREVLEETGLITKFVALRQFVNERIFPGQPDGKGAQFSIFVCEMDTGRGEPQEQDEGPVAWFHQEELDELWRSREIVPTDFCVLKHYIAAIQPLSYFEAEVVAETAGSTAPEIRRFEKIS